MEYIAAMDFEIDQVVPVRDPKAFSLFPVEEDLDLVSEYDYDFFMDDVNREMTEASILTELGPLPFLIRRNSSKRRENDNLRDKENSLATHHTLIKSYSIPRMNSSKRWNNFLGTSLLNDEPLKYLSRSSSLTNNQKLSCSPCQRDIQDLPRRASLRNTQEFLSSLMNTQEYSCTTGNIRCLSRSSSLRNTQDLFKTNNVENTHARVTMDGGEIITVDNFSQSLPVTEITEVGEKDASHPTELFHNSFEGVNIPLEDSQGQQSIKVQVDHYRNEQTFGCKYTSNAEINGDTIFRNNLENSDINSSLTEEEHPIVVETQTSSVCEQNLDKCPSQPKEVLNSEPNLSSIMLSRTTYNNTPINQDIDQQMNEVSNENPASVNGITEIVIAGTQSVTRKPCVALKKIFDEFRLENIPREGKQTQTEISSSQFGKDCHTLSDTIIKKSLKRKHTENAGDTPVFKKVKIGKPATRKTNMITRNSVRKLKKELPNHSATYSCQRKVQLFKAAEEGELEVVRKLINHTGPAIRSGKRNNTLLHVAAANNQIDVLIYLLELINPNVINKDDQTPAHIAAANGHTQILNILCLDKQFNPDKRDSKQRTFRDLLVAPVFKAVLSGDKKKVKSCLKLGADFDCHAGKLVNGTLARELGVTTPKKLAAALHGEHFLGRTKQEGTSGADNDCANQQVLEKASPHTGHNNNGYVFFLNFQSFSGHPELSRKNSTNINCLAKYLRKTGYTVDIHTSKTLEETKQTLVSVRDSSDLDGSRCAIFIISSHGSNGSFLTSDMEVLTTEWVMGMFRNTECPQLRNKPKLFILDFDAGHHLHNLHLGKEEISPRVEEPLNNMVTLTSENLLSKAHSRQLPFLHVLCEVLRHNCSGKDIVDVHRGLVRVYTNAEYNTVPEFINYGLTDKFCLVP